MNRNWINLITSIKKLIGGLFDLSQGKEREETTIAEIKSGVEFKGANLWILIFAIFIASIGLNVNSAAVIIGAMLISPLMGPIIGIGLGAGTNDIELIKKAFKNLGIAVLISVLTSATYFSVTPLAEAQSELLARTVPTLWDVLIAFFGGLAGIVVGSRKEKSNAVPGVAIATALMPPLCTAGYGLANGNWYYFVGAFYLFFINSVFISVATFLIVRLLKYPKHKYQDEAVEKRVRSYILVFVMLTIIPSVYLAYNVVVRTLFEQSARNFVATEFTFDQTQVIDKKFALVDNEGQIEVTLFGKILAEEEISQIRRNMSFYNLKNATLKVRQGYQEDNTAQTMQEFEKMGQSLKLGLLEDLYKKSDEQIRTKDDQIAFLTNQLVQVQRTIYPIGDIKAELKIQYQNIDQLALGDMLNQDNDTICYAVITFPRNAKKPSNSETKKIEEWLKIRAKVDSMVVFIK